MKGLLDNAWGNPSSDHVYGQQARVAADKARGEVANLLNCTPQEVFRGIPRLRVVTSVDPPVAGCLRVAVALIPIDD